MRHLKPWRMMIGKKMKRMASLPDGESMMKSFKPSLSIIMKTPRKFLLDEIFSKNVHLFIIC